MSAPATQGKAQSADTQVRHGCCHKKVEHDTFRRGCGCLKTSEKLKQILNKFPAPPPPTPINEVAKFPVPEARTLPSQENLSKMQKISSPEIPANQEKSYAPFVTTACRNSACVNRLHTRASPPFLPHYPVYSAKFDEYNLNQYKPEMLIELDEKPKGRCRVRWLATELVQLLQLFVTATALLLYYIIYCYMQLVYFTLQTAIYFHNADGPMKVTIAIVTLSALLVAFNLVLRMERCSWHECKHDAYMHHP